jgi:hypothetical protein
MKFDENRQVHTAQDEYKGDTGVSRQGIEAKNSNHTIYSPTKNPKLKKKPQLDSAQVATLSG